MKKTTYKYSDIMEMLDEIKLDIEILYEFHDIPTSSDLDVQYKDIIQQSINDLLRADWKCTIDEMNKIIELIVTLREQLQLCLEG